MQTKVNMDDVRKKIYKPGVPPQSLGICIYGKGGTGKTTLLGTMPGKGLVIDVPQIEGGTFVLDEQKDRIDVIPVEEWNEIHEVHQFLLKHEDLYRWVAIDSITAMTQLAIRRTIHERELDADPKQITLPEWGKVGRFVGELVYQFRTLKQHTIWIAQERSHGSEGEPKVIGPDVSPQALAMLLPSLTLVGRLSVEQNEEGAWERRLRVGPHSGYFTKCRAKPGLQVPPVIRNPNLGTLLPYLLFGRGDPPEAVQETSFIISGL